MERMEHHESVGPEFVRSAARRKGVLLFTAPQFLKRERRRKDLSNPVFRVTMQTARNQENASPLYRRMCRQQKRGGVFDHTASHRGLRNKRKPWLSRVSGSKRNGANAAVKYGKQLEKSSRV